MPDYVECQMCSVCASLTQSFSRNCALDTKGFRSGLSTEHGLTITANPG